MTDQTTKINKKEMEKITQCLYVNLEVLIQNDIPIYLSRQELHKTIHCLEIRIEDLRNKDEEITNFNQVLKDFKEIDLLQRTIYKLCKISKNS